MSQRAIACTLMRGGTSKGPFLDMRDLPADPGKRDRLLLAIMGSPDRRQIDGLGGADVLTSKLVLVRPSDRLDIDVDYLFAQVNIEQAIVDTRPPCGNMMAGVGPFALETEMVSPRDPETTVRIYNINTDTVIHALVQTPGGSVTYDGTTAIHGVPGTAAPVLLDFMSVSGSKTGKLFPTGKLRETIGGLETSLVDAAMPMVHLRAKDLGLSGDEDREFYRNHRELMAQIEELRLEAGIRMGLGNVADAVIPKVGLLFESQDGGSIRSHYLTPHSLHAAHAVTGGICVASACLVPQSIAGELADLDSREEETRKKIVLEHPSGHMEISILVEAGGCGLEDPDPIRIRSAGVLRTARKIMAGQVFVGGSLW